MHFHLPKPLHGWREFAGEVGIIVIGVLIALAAEQVVEAWRWHEKVETVRQSLMGELGNDRARWDYDVSGVECGTRDIERLDAWANGASNQPPPKLSVESSRLFSMHSTNWGLAASSQALDHFPMREQLAFAALYAGLTNRDKELQKAGDTLDEIQTLVPLASDQGGRRDLRMALGHLRTAFASLRANEGYMNRHFDALGVRPDRSDVAPDAKAYDCDGGRASTSEPVRT